MKLIESPDKKAGFFSAKVREILPQKNPAVERTTNHVVIEIDDSKRAQDVFEEIQNKFNFFDNCVLESDVQEEDSIIDADRQDETGGTLLWKRR